MTEILTCRRESNEATFWSHEANETPAVRLYCAVRYLKVILAGLGVVAASCATMSLSQDREATPALQPTMSTNAQELYLAGGCFWCVEGIFEMLKGVEKVESGYAGGHVKNPTYAQVCTGQTGHAEVVKVVYDPAVVSEDDLLHIFFTTHDPTTLNRQGPDVGTQYRSAIFYTSEEQKKKAEKIIADVTKEKVWPNPIVTTLEPMEKFYPAEDYHQDYYDKFAKASPAERMGMNAGYCAAVVEPKVLKFRQKYADKLKK